MTNIYLDVDGTILANDKVAAKHSEAFLVYLTENHNVYWLTTHVHQDITWVGEYLGRFLSTKAMKAVAKIKLTPKDWDKSKTESIDFTKPFLWFDDDLFPEERNDLLKHNALNCWVEIDLARNEDQLFEIINRLKSLPVER